MKLDLLESLAGPSEARLVLGCTIDVVKHRTGRATAGDVAQVADGVGSGQPSAGGV
jgi:hypothetical protein